MSKLETNQVDPATGTTLTLGTSGDTVTVPTGVGLTATDEVKSNKLSPATGTALQIGDSGDTITIPSGATITNNGTQTGFGGANTPAFLAYANADQGSISQNTYTKLTNFGAEVFDTDNKFASGSTFTPGVVGKYFVYGTVYGTGTNGSRNFLAVYVNGSTHYQTSTHLPGASSNFAQQVSAIVDVTSTSDYIELFFNSTGASATAYSSGVQVKFGGFKLIT